MQPEEAEADVRCPRCRLISPAGSQRCECGWDLIEGKVPFFRSGSTVVTEDGGTLPARCIKCNAPASGAPIRYTFFDSAVGNVPHGLISGILYFSSRRSARVFISLCGRHRRLRTMILWGCIVLVFGAAIMGFYATLAFEKTSEALMGIA